MLSLATQDHLPLLPQVDNFVLVVIGDYEKTMIQFMINSHTPLGTDAYILN